MEILSEFYLCSIPGSIPDKQEILCKVLEAIGEGGCSSSSNRVLGSGEGEFEGKPKVANKVGVVVLLPCFISLGLSGD
jgi:hypothetical protein